ncbi:MAG: hypothetical protein HXY38_13115 [Chloroflexi bacterium]|nr:hypothetical protein [Chloroflexota bacterium]
MKYAVLTELHNRMQADLLESYLEANGIDTEFFQESVGHSIYPVKIDGLGFAQVFVPQKKLKQAQKLLKTFEED